MKWFNRKQKEMDIKVNNANDLLLKERKVMKDIFEAKSSMWKEYFDSNSFKDLLKKELFNLLPENTYEIDNVYTNIFSTYDNIGVFIYIQWSHNTSKQTGSFRIDNYQSYPGNFNIDVNDVFRFEYYGKLKLREKLLKQFKGMEQNSSYKFAKNEDGSISLLPQDIVKGELK